MQQRLTQEIRLRLVDLSCRISFRRLVVRCSQLVIPRGALRQPIEPPSQLVLSLQLSARCLNFRRQSTIARCTIWATHHSGYIDICFGLTSVNPTASHDAGILSIPTARRAQSSPWWWLPNISSRSKRGISHITIWTAVTHEPAQSTGITYTTITKPESIPGTSINGLSTIWRCQHVPESWHFNLGGSSHGYCSGFRYAESATSLKELY